MVETVGSDVAGLSPGQRVALCCMPILKGKGSWQRYITLPESSVVSLLL